MISTCRAHKGTVHARLSRQTRKQQHRRTVLPDVFFPRARKNETTRRVLAGGVRDANARAGNDIGTNSRHAKARKAFTKEDVSKRLKRLREDLKNTNNATATIPSETTVGTRFSEVREHKSKFVLKSLLNSPSFVSLVSLWVRTDID